MVFRDSSGKTLADYPQPSVAVDTAVLTVLDRELCVVLVDAAGRLPGTFLHKGEVLADAVRRSLAQKAGIVGVEPRQLHVFDALDRDDRGWVLSVAHLAAVPWSSLDDLSPEADVVPAGKTGPLAFDHRQIIDLAVAELRADYVDRPDPTALLDEPFTLRDLQRLHETVAGRGLMRDAFRRKMEPLLDATGGYHRGTVGKPAREFRRQQSRAQRGR